MHQFSKKSKGFTLLELMVASSIMLGLSLVMVSLFATSKQTLIHGSNKLAIQQMARYSMNRILPYLQTVVPLTDTMKPIIEMHHTDAFDNGTLGPAAIGHTADMISFSTTHDFLTYPEPVFTPRAPVYYFYRLGFETAPKRELFIEKVVPSGPVAPPTAPTLMSMIPQQRRVITHGDKKAEAFVMGDASIKLENVTFSWIRQGEMAIQIKVDGPVRGAHNQLRTVSYDLDTRIQFPYYANR